jgi:hypothetical protein
MGSHPDKNWQKFHHRVDKVAVKAVPAYSEKYLNQNWQENAVSLTQKTTAVEPTVRTTGSEPSDVHFSSDPLFTRLACSKNSPPAPLGHFNISRQLGYILTLNHS